LAKYLRSVAEVTHGDNLIFPFESVPDKDEERWAAIIEVLRRIPEKDYQHLAELVDTFTWYAPHRDTLAEVVPFGCASAGETLPSGNNEFRYARVIFLSPQLNDVDLDVAVACVSHEIAHVILDHEPIHPLPEVAEHQEREAWDKVRDWGFAEEAEAHKGYRSRSDE